MEYLKVAAYCRVSTEKEDQLMSLHAQKEFFGEYAKRNHLQLVDLYADEGISGTKLKNRREFLRMMHDAQLGKFACVYVKDVSRLARNVVDFLQSIRKLKAWNIDCRFVTANMSSNDGELTLTILAAVAQEESANLSKRVKFGKKRNAQKGRVPNLVYGYNKKIGDYFDLEINQAEAQIVRRIFKLYIDDGYGMNKIAQILNQEGLRTKRDSRWRQQAIATILSNQLYIGKIINGKESIKDFLTGERIKHKREDQFIVDKSALAIVLSKDFWQAQQILTDRNQLYHNKGKRYSNKYCFSTLIKCASCGYSFRRIYRKYVKVYIRWSCSGRNANGIAFCDNHTVIDESVLLAEIKQYLSDRLVCQDKLLEKLVGMFAKRYRLAFHKLDRQVLLDELDQLKKRKKKQLEMFERDIINLEELKNRLAVGNLQIANHEKDLQRSDVTVLQSVEKLAKQYFSSLDDLLASQLPENMILRKLIDQVMVDKTGEITVYLKDFFKKIS